MRAIRWLIRGVAIAFVVTGAPAEAQSTLDAQALKLYGGTYLSDCSNATAPRLRVVADALMVEQGTERLTGRNVQAAYSYFGQSPPPDYQVALLSEVRGGSQLLFIVHRDKSGQYITLDGDAKVQATLGKALLGRKYRSCDAVKKETASTPPGATQPEPVVDAGALLTDSKFKSAYYKALGPMVKENWLAKLDGPAPLNKKVKSAVRSTCWRAPARITTAPTTTPFCSIRLHRGGVRKDRPTAQGDVDRHTPAGSGCRIGSVVDGRVAAETINGAMNTANSV